MTSRRRLSSNLTVQVNELTNVCFSCLKPKHCLGCLLWLLFSGEKDLKTHSACFHYPAVVEANKLARDTGNFAAEQRDVSKKAEFKIRGGGDLEIV